MSSSNKRYSIFPFLLLLLTFVGVNQWSDIQIGNTLIINALKFLILYVMIYEKYKNNIQLFSPPYGIVAIYLIWAVIGIIRGCYVAENYWEWKNLMNSSLIVLLPFCVYTFYEPDILHRSLRLWYPWALFAYVIFFYWQVHISQFYLGPVYFAICFLPIVPTLKWKIIFIILDILILTTNIENDRSQFVKAVAVTVICCLCLFRKFIGQWIICLSSFILFILPFVFLVLGLTGEYNVFEDTSDKYEGQYVSEQYKEGSFTEYDISTDTRTFIYSEVISSAINNEYVTFGRTPARGNDTEVFYYVADEMQATHAVENIKHERPKNEVGFPNIFTWLGIVGLILYLGIYLTAAIYGLFKSKNFYVKMCGLMTSFNFFFSWVENTTIFDILNITYWIFISICLSKKYREMNDDEFKTWFKTIFKRTK